MAQTDFLTTRPDFRNQLYDPAPTNTPGTSLAQAASVAICSGNIGATNAAVTPTDGTSYLLQSIIGQPVGGLPYEFLLPDLAVNAPTNGAKFTALGVVPVSAQAWHLAFDGFVSNVSFYATGAAIGTNVLLRSFTNSLPGTNTYAFSWSNVVSGAYTLTVVATDNRGGTVTNPPVSVEVIAPFVLAQQGRGTVTASPAQTSFVLGQQVTLTAAPGRYYTFLQWSDGVLTTNRTVTIGTNNFYSAIFTNTVPLEELILKQWDKSYGGNGNDDLRSVRRISDGGFILSGQSDSSPGGNKSATNFGSTDYWVVRLDANGTKLWDKACGGTGWDGSTRIAETTDGGFLVGGSSASGADGGKTSPNFGGDDFWVVRLDANGNKLWDQSFGGSNPDNLYSLAQTSDGGFILGGTSASGSSGNKTSPNYGTNDFWVVRLDANGGKLWDITFGGSGEDSLSSLQQTPDGGFILGGSSTSGADGNKTSTNFGYWDFWIVRLDASGNKLWDRTFGGTGSDERLWSLQRTANGDYILGGRSGGDSGIVRLDSNGNKLLEQSFGGTNEDTFQSVRQTADGGFVLAGYSAAGAGGDKTAQSFGGYDFWLVRLNPYGNKTWDMSFGGALDDNLWDFDPIADEGFVFGGTSYSIPGGNKTDTNYGASDFWITKLAVREAPIGMPVVLVNGLYSPSNSFAIPATNSVIVSLQTSYAGGFLFYTLDGSDPDFSSNPYDVPFTNSQPAVLRAIAYDSGGANPVEADPVTINIVPIYNLTNTTPGGGSVVFNPPSGVYLSNTVVTATATASNGWTFMNWSGLTTVTNNPLTLTVSNSGNLAAVFGTTIASTTNGTTGASVALWPTNGPYAFGSTVRFIGVPPAGKAFSRWFNFVSGPTNNPLDFVVTTNNPVASAFFSNIGATNFTLTTLLNGYGSVTRSPAANFYLTNTTVQLTAVPDAGYVFTGWSGNASGLANPVNVILNSNKVVTAGFIYDAFPNVALTSPTNGQTVDTSGFTLTASASDDDGTVALVQFFIDGNLVGSASSVPYAITLTNQALGNHLVTAKAFDNLGGTSTSALVTINVGGILVVRAPQSLSIRSGVNPHLSVIATSSPPSTLSYQWRRGSTNLAGEIFPTLFLLGVSTADSGSYSVVITGPGGLSNSATASVIVTQTPPTLAAVWGRYVGSATDLGPGNGTFVGITATDFHVLALRHNGTVAAWSWNGTPGVPAGLTNLVAIDGGGGDGTNQCIGLKRDGSVVRWDFSGNEVFDVPPGLSNVVGVAAGNRAYYALKRDGTVVAWGVSVGGSTNVPAGLTNVVAISSGDADWAMALKSDGTVVGWGADGGWGGPTMSGLANNIAACAGGFHGLVQRADGQVVAWGSYLYGQTNVPPGTTNVLAMSAGLEHNLAIRGDGKIIAWGNNADGQTNVPSSVLHAVDVASSWGISAALYINEAATTTNIPPTIDITNPQPGAMFTSPASISIHTTNSDSDGLVTQVAFLNGAMLLGTVTNPPFSFVWTNAPVGSNTLQAVATDDGGLSTTSAPVSITVQTAIPQIVLTSPTNGASYFGPTNVAFSALASDADNSISNVSFFAGTNLLATLASPPFNFTWSNVAVGNYTLSARVQDVYGPMVTSSPVNISVLAPNIPAVFRLLSASFGVAENVGSLAVVVTNAGTLGGTVNYACADVTATGGSGGAGDYARIQGSLTFTNGELARTLSITLNNDLLPESAESFDFLLSSPGSGASLGSPSSASITILDDDDTYATNSWLAIAFPGEVPDHSGKLRVTLTPPEAGGQWRFPWELGWRTNGVLVTNLEVGNYDVELRPVSGYVAVPSTVTVAVNGGGSITESTNQYFAAGPGGVGYLQVVIQPNTVSNAGWRFVGEGAFRASGSTATNLVPGPNVIEFTPVSGWSAPARRVVQVYADQGTVVTGSYLVADTNFSALFPLVVNPFSVINESLTYPTPLPYAFNGQLQSPKGFGSGVAVRDRVVLTAAHMVFDDETLSYVTEMNWFFQKHAGDFDPKPAKARGWYVLSSYSAARSNDLAGGYYAPGQSSPQSRNWDVAALYFNTAATRGGYGGYLTSDGATNDWLVSSRQKMLTGYPLDGAAYGYAGLSPGKLHATAAQNYSFTQLSNRVYTTSGFLSFPGNSGGPVYVLNSNAYYPAGVYLGTLGNNLSVVRSIDSNVVNLINLAAWAGQFGDAGENFTGGGVLRWIAGAGAQFNPGLFRVNLSPTNAVTLGAGWRVVGGADTNWISDSNYYYSTNPGAISVEFRAVTGYATPANRTVNLTANQTTVIDVTYPTLPVLVVEPVGGLAATGYVGGPFAPASISYALTNAGGTNLTWLANKSVGWLSLAPDSGTLIPGGSTNVLVTVNATANSLVSSNYTDTVFFTNVSSSLGSTSRVVTLTVNAPLPLLLQGPVAVGGGGLRLTLSGTPGRDYAIQFSTNLNGWADIFTVSNLPGDFTFTNTSAGALGKGFYRAKQLP